MVYETRYVRTLSIPEWWALHHLYAGYHTDGIRVRDMQRVWGKAYQTSARMMNLLEKHGFVVGKRSGVKMFLPVDDAELERLVVKFDAEMMQRIFAPTKTIRRIPAAETELKQYDALKHFSFRNIAPVDWWVLAQLYRWNVPGILTTDICWTWNRDQRYVWHRMDRLRQAGLVVIGNSAGYARPNTIYPVANDSTRHVVTLLDAAMYQRFVSDYVEMSVETLDELLMEVTNG